MVNVEVVVMVAVAVMEEVPMEEDVGIKAVVTNLETIAIVRTPENKRKCSNHTVLGNTR